MSGFIRRFGYFPTQQEITAIEGVVIVDTPPPAGIAGVGTGTTTCIGEFADCGYAVIVSSAGVVTQSVRPIEVFGAQDLLNKAGGWDETIGQFGNAQGNGFVEIRNKTFSRLIITPVDFVTCSSPTVTYGIRFWRQLPTNQSATVALPIVPVSGAAVAAGREFKATNNRVRTAKRFVFSDAVAFVSATDGAVTATSPAATQNFISATGNFVVNQVQAGDALVLGVIGGAGALGANADTFRIVSVTNGTTLVVQKLDGTNFDWTTGTALPYRIHPASTIDSGATLAGAHAALSGAAAFVVPARPLDATVAAATALVPTIVPTAGTASTWEVLSGLTGATHPTGALTYEAAVHAPNAGNSATMDARYQASFDALLNDDYPARDVNIVWAARKSSTIRSKGKSHVVTASQRGLTRRFISSPQINTLALTSVIADADPGVGAQRSDRVDYSWPGCTMSVPEAVNYTIATADGQTTVDGILDVSFDGWLAAIESNLAPERNPGQATSPIPEVLSPVIAMQRGVSRLSMAEYITLRNAGIAALKFDRTAGPIIQSGVTTSLVAGEKNISRRRMADFCQDSMAQRVVSYSKQPATQANRDAITAEINEFLNGLLSPNIPAAQRIAGYEVDPKSGNTPQMTAAGIFVVVVRIRLMGTLDFIVLQTEIGEGVTIRQVQ